jgi:Phage tail assembly chaperone protein
MIKNYIIYKESGEILRTGTCPTDDFEAQANKNEFVLEGIANSSTNYIKNNSIAEKPTKPEGYYVFDFYTEQWVFDRATAELVALSKRDKLLAEGPDRISPMWWSSMTPEEQQAWTDYRQALLDITEQPNYPQEIIWPTKP